MNKLLSIIILILGFALSGWTQVITQWSSQAVVPGEKTLMLVIMTNGEMVQPLPTSRIEGASVRFAARNYMVWNGSPSQRAFYYVAFEVVADKPGIVTIPSIELKGNNGAIYKTAPQSLKVYPFDAIKWTPIPQSGGRRQYGTLWHIDDQTPYVNQPTMTELKFYVPPDIVEYQLPSIKADGLATWRFEPQPSNINIFQFGSALISGYDWKVCSFHSALTPLRSGKVKIGGTETMFALDSSADPILAQFTRNMISIPMEIPEFSFEARPLPPGAPAGFKNAVGQFTIKATTDARDLSANEPISVQITISGTGNINTLSAPEPKDPSRWKLYPANKIGNDEARSLSGSVTFQQLLRPTAETDAVPPFELVYFDPSTQQYELISTPAIPLPWKATAPDLVPASMAAAATPPPAGDVPVAKMTDIYGLVPLTMATSLKTPDSSSWYLLAYLPVLLILAFAGASYIRKKRLQTEESRERMAAFKAIPVKESTPVFLRSIGSFIETYIPESKQDETLRKILATRDELAFLPQDTSDNISDAERKSMVKHVRTILAKLPVVFLLTCLLLPIAMQEVQAAPPIHTKAAPNLLYERGEFTEAAKAYAHAVTEPNQYPGQKALDYYGLGNSLYRLNKPGEAALAYNRALNICPGFTEARKNLEFIERKEGAILPINDQASEWLTFVGYHSLPPIIILSGAVLLTALVLLLLYHRYVILLTVLCVLGGLSMAAAIANRAMYPVIPETVNPSSLLIVTQATPARHAADASSPTLMTLPPSTPLILQAKRGSWYYVRTFTGTPAWIHADSASPVLTKKLPLVRQEN
ncbi:tetratricopeptide repeat protein [Akkermansia sp. N21169]|jgi:tetratricopeptide (TPR) repeat protein|uniref:tetratricopeptide repeat protein n=1 Tax=Akkermansia sp. N21169 TaxID=3040765 RepID=UPI00244E94E1|nr:tetratricopeptide repeat protein [Akkermansia sp. N21169]MDH3068589.1 tetratricopeptide repeat protein [Akkermansia sp. N21169]